MPIAYCFKCRQKREIKDPKQIALKNGKRRKPRIVPPTKQKEVAGKGWCSRRVAGVWSEPFQQEVIA